MKLLKKEDFMVDTTISSNSNNSIIYKGKIITNEQLIALKIPKISEKNNIIFNFKREVEILKNIRDCTHICELISYHIDEKENASDKNKTFICYEFMSNGTLSSLLMMSSSYKEQDITVSIAKALHYLHKKGFMHRDIKSSNILLDSNFTPKLGGFDLSCSYLNEEELTPETGTYRWMAPEIIRHENYNNFADVYSYGILLWEIFTREVPYADMSAIEAAYEVAKNNLRPYISLGITPRKKALICRCWHEDPKARPSFEDILGLLPSLYL